LSAEIVVRSTGTVGAATQQIQAQLTKTYDLADAAMGVRGNPKQVDLSGGTVTISGLDHDPVSGIPLPSAKPRSAVSTDAATYQMVDQAGSQLPAGNFISGSDGAAIATSEYLSSAAIGQLADRLCGLDGTIVSSLPSSGTLVYENQSWGNRTTPQIRCIDGINAINDSVTLSGVNGAGILIVRNSDLVLTSQFRWEGLIIVTGSSVALKVSDGGMKDVYGAVLVNETGVPDSSKAILDIQGNIRIRFSRQALTQAAALIPPAVINSTIASLPISLKQNYWRTITP
jgi:hypothetical protein